jgi:hypothetical protein
VLDLRHRVLDLGERRRDAARGEPVPGRRGVGHPPISEDVLDVMVERPAATAAR